MDVPSPTPATTFEDGPVRDTPAGGAAAWSPDGAVLALAGPTGVALLDGATGAQLPGVRPLPVRAPRAITWSPGGAYVLTYARPPNLPKAGEPPTPEEEAKNLALWRAADGSRVLAFSHRGAFNPREAGWPLQVCGADDDVAWHLVTNAVNAYALKEKGGNGNGAAPTSTSSPAAVVMRKLPCKGVASFAPSPDGGVRIAAFVPEAKGSPAWVGVWEVESLPAGPSGGGGGGGAGGAPPPPPPPPLARRSFFRANACSLLWAPPLDPAAAVSASKKGGGGEGGGGGGGDGAEAPLSTTRPTSTSTAVLALASSDADATNQSYYGEQQLHYLAADGSADCLVPLPKKGPIHDVAWSPRGDTFCALAGFMPPKATLFAAGTAKGGEGAVPVYDLGSGPWSLVRFSPPSGRFLALCGFGNLAGDVAFFDRKADGKLKPCGAVRCDNGGQAAWAPDGRHLVVATLAPRLRVDNGLRLVKYDGSLLASRPYPVLLEAAVRPAPTGAWPDRPPSPRAAGADGKAGGPVPCAVPARPAGYLPPHLRGGGGGGRGGGGGGAPAPLFSLAYDLNETGPKKISAGGGGGGGGTFSRPLPPGAEPAPGETKAASKNAKRRAAAARKKAEEDGVAGLAL